MYCIKKKALLLSSIHVFSFTFAFIHRAGFFAIAETSTYKRQMRGPIKMNKIKKKNFFFDPSFGEP